MSLNNLVGITLETIEPDSTTIIRLLRAVERNIADANLRELSTENRFDVAYKAIMQLANTALQANGYRTLTSKPGHHQTMLQVLSKTIGLDIETVMVLDALRKQRNVADYSGDLIPETAMKECIEQAKNLFDSVTSWIRKKHPKLLENF